MRLIQILRKDFLEDKRSWMIYGIAIVAVISGIELLDALLVKYQVFSLTDPIYTQFFFWFLFLGGAISTSTSFEDMFNRTKQHNFLMLPASTFEKFISRALISTVLYPIVLLALMSALSLIVETILYLIFKSPIILFNPLNPLIIRFLPLYFVMNALFFFGATYFRKTHFIKTVFVSWLVLFSLGFFAILFARILIATPFSQMESFYIRVSYIESSFTLPAIYEILFNIIVYVIVPLFLFYVSYLRIEEVQSTDAIQ